jgi:4-amino-4-deoxy-L-arabinose transferase-like glycosyltransferase
MSATLQHPAASEAESSAAIHAPTAAPSTREWLALGAILLVSALLAFVRLDIQGMGNPYYAATVRSMLEGPRNLFFAAYDPAGWVSVDKPPVGFWAQSLSASLLGYRGFALLLPQALATVGAVALAWVIARRAFGPAAAALSALALALTPISVATGRTNTIDPLLVVVLLGAAWALLAAIERGSTGWLIGSAALIGLGFNIKMLQAWLILPAWGLAWLLATRQPWRQRIGALAAASVVLVIVSFAWMTVVELTPSDERPFVGSSSANSSFDLAFGYNGLQRLLPPGWTGAEAPANGSAQPPSPGVILATFGAIETGERSPLRLFNRYLAAQIAWLLPLAAIGGLAAWTRVPGWRDLHSRRCAALLFFGGWLATAIAFFSVANQFHRYYLVMLAPPIAVLAGAGAAAMWSDWRESGRRGWLLPLAIAGTGVLAAMIARPYPAPWQQAGVAAAALAIVAAGLLVALRSRSAPGGREAGALVAAAAALVALLLGPAIWSASTMTAPISNTLPAAGPGGNLLAGFAPQPGAASDAPAPPGFDAYQPPDPALVAFLERNNGGERFMLATGSAMTASPLIVERAMPVAALGGFIGQDPIVDPRGLQAMIGRGEVRYVLVPDPRRVNLLKNMAGLWGSLQGGDGSSLPGLPALPARPGDKEQDAQQNSGALAPDASRFLQLFLTPNVRWVAGNCTPVPPREWQSPGRVQGNPLAGLDALYDCRAAGG